MKKIAIITSGLLPMPSVKDGAIETLLQYTLDYNEIDKKAEFDVYSIYDEEAILENTKYKNTKYIYIKVNTMMNIIKKYFLRLCRKLKILRDPNFQSDFIKKVYKKMENKKYDYVIVESENHFTEYLLKKTRIPVILYLHNDKLNNSTHNGIFIIDNVYKVLVVSEYMKRRVLTLGKEYNNKINVIHNGGDLNKYLNIIRDNKYNDTVNFLFVGRLEKEKGVLELIKAFNNMKNRNTKLFIVGGTFHSSNKKSKYYNEIVKEANKRKEDIVFTGYIKHKELVNLYRFIDVQVVPSLWEEPAGLVNIEAIAANVSLIASNVGGIPEYVNKETILVDKDQNFINNLTLNMDKMKKNSKLISDFDINYFSKEEYVKRYYKIIGEL